MLVDICMYGHKSGDRECYFCSYFSSLNSKCAYESIKKRLQMEKEVNNGNLTRLELNNSEL